MNLIERSIHNHNALKLKQEIEKKRKCINFRIKLNYQDTTIDVLQNSLVLR